MVILGGPHDLIQTIYHEDSIGFDAVSINKSDGKIAVSNEKETYIYGPYGKDEGSLKVGSCTFLDEAASKIFGSGHYNAVLESRRRSEECLPYPGD